MRALTTTPCAGSGFDDGDLVVGVVRRPDPEPCGACGAGEFDMCGNGQYTERGTKQREGYCAEPRTALITGVGPYQFSDVTSCGQLDPSHLGLQDLDPISPQEHR
jgi:hypothetical protein